MISGAFSTGWILIINTEVLVLTNKRDPFTPDSLTVKFLEPNVKNIAYWNCGTLTAGNLLGIFCNLGVLDGPQNTYISDSARPEDAPAMWSCTCELGVVSWAGWALVDAS